MSSQWGAVDDVAEADGEDLPTRGAAVEEVGTIVVDADDEDPDRDDAVVVNLPPVAAEDWEVGSETVADHNPTYDAEAEVVVVAFRPALERARPDWSGDAPLALADLECSTYAFPAGRLRRVGTLDDGEGGKEDGDTATEPADRLTDAQRDLRDRLAETCEVGVEADPEDDDEAVLVVEKLGEEHRITADGAVTGPLAGRLEAIAAEYLGGEEA